ncbi:MAG: aspartate aminotransferase family protein [Gammaproteobacteria bacterium]|nr:aspartate aminotransferase family protein [Gammaproteobacteria bacterium]
MSHVIHRNLLATPRKAVQGDGVYIIDEQGKRYLDGSGGAAVSCLGHNNPVLIAAIDKQMAALPYAHTSFFTTDVLEELGTRVVELAPGMDKAMFLCGGSEAVEAALKLSRQFFVENGEPERRLFVARRQSYHGNTLGALGVGGNEWRRKSFTPILTVGHHIAPCFEYRERPNGEDSYVYGQRVADELETMLQDLGPKNVAAFVAETVVGATAGAVPAVPGYFARVREICDEYGVHLILDEVMCGSGRTGSFCAYEPEGITPDIVTLAKGLAGGYQPVGALLCRGAITDTIKNGSGYFQHGHTFMGHATAIAAALATVNVMRDEKLIENVAKLGSLLKDQLQEALGELPYVGDIRGRGFLIGIEFVEDRDSKKPFDPALKIHKKIQASAMEHQLLCYGMGGTVDGYQGDHILIAPPYIANEEHIAELVEKLSDAVNATLN